MDELFCCLCLEDGQMPRQSFYSSCSLTSVPSYTGFILLWCSGNSVCNACRLQQVRTSAHLTFHFSYIKSHTQLPKPKNLFGFCLSRTCFLVNTLNLQLPMKSNTFLGKISLADSPNLQSGTPSLGSEKRWGRRKSLENLRRHLKMTKRRSQDPTLLMWLVL